MEAYIVYDGRARFDIGAASVLDTADTLGEAFKVAALHGADSVIVRYDKKDDELSNPRIVSTGNRRIK